MASVVGEEVAEGVGRIPGFVNAYVFHDESGRYLIDTGMARKARHIRRAFERAGVPLTEIGTIVLTHHHMDHVGGAAFVRSASQAKIACHAEDAPAIDGRVRPAMPLLLRLLFRPRPVAVSALLKEGDSVGPFRVVFVPGHTPGEIALYHPGRRLLFSGDSVVERNGSLTLPAARFASNLTQAVASLAVLRQLPVEALLPGHGVPVTQDVAGRLDDLIARAPGEFLARTA